MSDQDNLRDRIAEVIYHEDVAHICPEPASLVALSVLSPGEQETYQTMAQAIIDEFGLTVETEPGHDPRECGCSSRAYPAESRVVGKWEQR